MKKNLLKKTSIAFVFILIFSGIFAQSPSFKTYINPVIPGDHPDCTVSKIGKYFYTTGSSFNVTPTIYRSTDLVHWEAISHPVSNTWTSFGDKPGGGCWGGHVVFYDNKFWHFFMGAGSMHFTTATSDAGPWSSPTRVNNPTQLPYTLGYDNSIFIDDDGKWYLIVKNGQPNNGIVELGTNGQPTGVVYNLDWLNPAPSYPYSWAEGPVMWKYKGYYYYSFARDLGGGQKSMRSATLTAESTSWEFFGDFFNESDPLKSSSLFSGPNHASNAVMLDDSTSWVVHPIYAKDSWRGQGRQGLLNQVRYSAAGKPIADYPTNKYFTAPNLSSSGIPWMVPKSDFFSSTSLNPEWCQLGYTPADKLSLSEKAGWLRLTPKTSKLNTLTKNDGEHNYSLITKVDFDAVVEADEAGLIIIRGDEAKTITLSSSANASGTKTVKLKYESFNYEVTNNIGKVIWLKLNRVNHIITGYYSADGVEWTKIGENLDVTAFDTYSDFSSFTGNRQGLFVQNKKAYFDFYIYREASTLIPADYPANQYGTSRTALTANSGVLDQIHNSDWAMYAGVEFGNVDYQLNLDSIECVAACQTAGGVVEVWLDSIETGNKIAECSITSTGSISVYKPFKCIISEGITGRHDVYLRFKSQLTTSLFRLQSFRFLLKHPDIPDVPSSIKEIENQINIYPNPANNSFKVQANFEFNCISVVGIDGKRVIDKTISSFQKEWINTQTLAKGIYIISIGNGEKTASKKIVIE